MMTMMEQDNSYITSNQLTCIIILTVLGIEVLFFPNLVIYKSGQDSWICTICGGVYPVFIVFIANFMCKKFPKYNILKLSRKFLGSFFGTVLNILFLAQFIVYSAARCAQLSNLTRLYTNYFITHRLAITIIIIGVVISSLKELNVLARSNEVIFYFTIIMALVPIGVFTRGDPYNLLPVFKVTPVGVAAGTLRAGCDYFGIEIIFLLYPYLKNKKDLLTAGLKASAICAGIYTWFTFATIYYFGIDIIPKYLWVVVETTKAFHMQTIKNFTFIFIIFWNLIILRNISNNYFSSTLILNDLWGRISMKKYTIVLAPLIFYIALKLGDETKIRALLIILVPLFTVYNILYVSIIALLIKMKGHQTNENT